MSSVAHAQVDQAQLDLAEKAKVKKYMNVFWALCAFTVFEVGIVFFEKVLSKLIIDSVVIVFTMLKAGFVGYYFMHLEYEKAWTKIVAVLALPLIGLYAVFLLPDTVRERPISLYIPEAPRVLPAELDPAHKKAAETTTAPVQGAFFQVRGDQGDSPAAAAAGSGAGVSAPGAGAPAGGAAPAAGGDTGNPLDSVESWR